MVPRGFGACACSFPCLAGLDSARCLAGGPLCGEALRPRRAEYDGAGYGNTRSRQPGPAALRFPARSVNAGAHKGLPPGSPVCSSAPASPGHVTAWHSEIRRSERERTGACKRPTGVPRYARMRALTDVTSETLRQWRQSQGWDVPRMARELRKAARDSGEDVAAHHGLVKMIPQWERGNRAPRERYQLLYLKIFKDIATDMVPGMASGVDLAMRLAEVRSRAASLPGPGQIRALEAAALTRPRASLTPAEIRTLAEEAIAHLHEVAGKLAELSALLGHDEAEEGKP